MKESDLVLLLWESTGGKSSRPMHLSADCETFARLAQCCTCRCDPIIASRLAAVLGAPLCTAVLVGRWAGVSLNGASRTFESSPFFHTDRAACEARTCTTPFFFLALEGSRSRLARSCTLFRGGRSCANGRRD